MFQQHSFFPHPKAISPWITYVGLPCQVWRKHVQKEVTTYHLVPMRTDTKPLCVYQDLRYVCPLMKHHQQNMLIDWFPSFVDSLLTSYLVTTPQRTFMATPCFWAHPRVRVSQLTGEKLKIPTWKYAKFVGIQIKKTRDGWYAGKVIQDFLWTMCRMSGETRSKNSKNSQKICQNTKLLSYTRATSKIALGFIKPHQGTLHWQELFIWKSQVCLQFSHVCSRTM